MSHFMADGKTVCALSDGHKSFHRSPESMARQVERTREWHKAADKNNPQFARKKALRAKQWAAENPERTAEQKRKARLKREYGMTPEEYNLLLSEQKGVCAICSGDPPEKQSWLHIDHDHDTGNVRGLLCVKCNMALGYMNDSPDLLRAAANYLEVTANARGDV